MKKALFAIIVIIILGYVVYSNTGDKALAPVSNDGGEVVENGGEIVNEPVDDSNSASGTVPAGESACVNAGGLNALHGECLGIDAKTCQEIGGTFNECASACRHEPNAEVCTMQCVQVCEINI